MKAFRDLGNVLVRKTGILLVCFANNAERQGIVHILPSVGSKCIALESGDPENTTIKPDETILGFCELFGG